MPTFNLNDLLKVGAKVLLFSSLLALLQVFVKFLVSKIPSVSIGGCAGYWFEHLGVFFGLRLMLSIILYGFVAKFALSFISRVLD